MVVVSVGVDVGPVGMEVSALSHAMSNKSPNLWPSRLLMFDQWVGRHGGGSL